MLTKLFQLVTFIALLFLVSCIGEIDDADPPLTKNSSMNGNTDAFGGIEKVTPISNDKVEVYWRAANLDPLIVTYLIYVNNTDDPIEVKAESLTVTESGLYRYVVDDLQVATEYSFKVGIRNSETAEVSTKDKELFVTTFSNNTANFGGVSFVSLVEGVGGRTSIKVAWSFIPIGSINFPRDADSVQYEIRFMRADVGDPKMLLDDGSAAVSKQYIPASVSSPPRLCKDQSAIVGGLSEGKKYYFLVRSIHANALNHKDNPNYLTEKNGKILSITTRESGALFEFDGGSVKVFSADGEAGLTSMDVTWTPAGGDYHHYRLFHIKVGDSGDDPLAVDAIADQLGDDELTLLGADADNYTRIDPGTESNRIKNLTSYGFYQLKVVACKEPACGVDKRIASSLVRTRVVPRRAPFNGVLSIENPVDLATSDTVTAIFDPPVVSSGYANKLYVYCFEGANDTSPELLIYNTSIVSAKPSCNGLKLLSQPPITTNEMSSYGQVKISGITFPANSTISDKKICLSVVADIDTPFMPASGDLGVIKCIIPELPVPTKDDFPGKLSGCNIAAGYGLDVNWPTPSAGIYERYEVYWKDADDIPFRFENAVAGDLAYTNAIVLQGTNTYSITSLVPGRTYEVGVLTSITVDGQKKYSEFNSSVSKCTIPAPSVTFNEWVDIFAVGAKVDGRIPKGVGGVDTTVVETLDDNGLPIEVEINSSTGTPTTLFEDKFGDVRGLLDGVYGTIDGNLAAAKFRFSNNGIVRIGWKDFTIAGETTEYETFISSYEAIGTAKNLRRYGYKVLRSINGGRSWVDLTSKDYPFQSTLNAGFTRVSNISERVRNNEPLVDYKGVVFTDYSVSGFDSVDTTDRARIYLYRVVPYFDGKEIPITNADQSIIKVVLPPKNMALVNRLMANRSACLEIDKVYSTDIDLYYSCPYNGLGARGLSVPWNFGNTRLDLGGDLLVDRFEMGCNITRGDIHNSRSKFSGMPSDFMGQSEVGSPLVGCFTSEVNGEVPLSRAFIASPGGNAPADGIPYQSYKQVLFGDCFGDGRITLSNSKVICADDSRVSKSTIYFPGARGETSCDTGVDQLIDNYLNPYYESVFYAPYDDTVLQSEFGAVYYHRTGPSSSSQRALSEFRAAGGDSSNSIRLNATAYTYSSSCGINLPVVDNSADADGGGRWKPRWIYLDQLKTLAYDHDGNSGTAAKPLNIFNATVADVLADPYLYDNLKNEAPASYNTDRITAGMTLAGLMTSSNAKLPPITGLSQGMADDVCNSHQVELGWESAAGSFEQFAAPVDKRLMNRKEFVLAAAWPKSFDETKIYKIEKGTNLESLLDAQNINLSCNAAARNMPGYQNFGYGDAFEVGIAGKGVDSRIISGSSYFDSLMNLTTQKCQSRYGIQDIVGNLGEYTSDQITCDFSGETMYIGDGALANSVLAPDWSLYNNEITPWVLSDEGTGRCSIAEQGSDRLGTYLVGSYILPSYFQGTYNSDVIPFIAQNTIDLNAPEDLRAGDGIYMDFGQSNFAPSLNKNDTMALAKDSLVDSRSINGGATNPIVSRYFNPVVGLSLNCGMGACATSMDNMSISTNYYVGNSGLDPATLAVADFPINHSQILSDGMSEIGKWRRYTLPSLSEGTVDFIDSINLGDGTINRVEESLALILGSFEIWTYNWRVDRNQRLILSNGGDSKSGLSGRYSAHVKTQSYVKNMRSYTGFRCAVRVKVD